MRHAPLAPIVRAATVRTFPSRRIRRAPSRPRAAVVAAAGRRVQPRAGRSM